MYCNGCKGISYRGFFPFSEKTLLSVIALERQEIMAIDSAVGVTLRGFHGFLAQTFLKLAN